MAKEWSYLKIVAKPEKRLEGSDFDKLVDVEYVESFIDPGGNLEIPFIKIDLQGFLKAFGEKGWELISIFTDEHDGETYRVYYLKMLFENY